MTTIIHQYADMTPARCGNKAAHLAALRLQGFNVPEFFVIEALPPGDGAAGEALGSALRAMRASAFAVRSSSREEDGPAHSFAGQFDTFLAVSADEVPQRARQVAASGNSERLRSYREASGRAPEARAPAVIVQSMIDAECAGVAFAADPVSGDPEVAVVAATRGTGEALVSGHVQGDTWRVGRDGRVRSSDIAGAVPVLDRALVEAVAALVRAVSDAFGLPQDIEWAAKGGSLYLLQSRAITTAIGRAAEDTLALWDNSNIVESYGGITLPLTFSVARNAYASAYRQMGRALGIRERTIRENRRAYEHMIGLVRGRVYYNLLNWYRLLLLTPGFRYNARFMEQMMGVTDELPAETLPTLPEPGRFGRLRMLADYARVGGRLLFRLLTHRRDVRRFHAEIDRLLAPADVGQMTLDALADDYERLQSGAIAAWDTPLVNDLYCMIFHGALRAASVRWLGDDFADRHNDLVAGEAAIVSLEPVRRMRAMARLARGDGGMVRALCRDSAPEVWSALACRPALLQKVGDYIDRFGDRCLDELKLESATLADDPLPLFRAIGHLAAGPDVDGPAVDRAQEAEDRVGAALSGRPVRHWLYRRLLGLARARIRDRENLRFERTRVYGRVRAVFLAIGRRLQALGCLNRATDIFYLEAREALEFIRGTGTGTPLSEIVRVRRRTYADYETADVLPRRFVTAGPPHRDSAIRLPDAAVMTAGDVRRGQACCHGVVRGRVRVVSDPRRCDFRRGDILVAERTDPGWVTIFPLVKGMIMERGSLLSHSAIVARELGIPAIVGVDGACTWLRDGDRVELDGGSGLIRKLGDTGDAA